MEGPQDQLFNNFRSRKNAILLRNNVDLTNDQATAEVKPVAQEDNGMDRTLLHTETSDQIAFLRAEGFAVDDDNEPME